MRTLLVLLAAVGLPLYALAQPVAGDGKPTEASQSVVEARKAAEVSELMVTGTRPCPDPGDPQRLHAYRKLFDAPPDTKNKRTEESAGTRAFVLMMVAGFISNNTDYTRMSPGLAKSARAQFPRNRSLVVCQGVFKGIKFLHVSQVGWDDFEVDFSNGALEWAVKPFDSHQVTDGNVWGYFYPQPATKQFGDLLKSMGRGRPNYADLTPDFASRLRARWPALQKSQKDWGRLRGFRFVRREDDGSYVYLATYEHRQVVWTASPQNADGKFTALTYDE